MTNEELESHFRSLGWVAERLIGNDGLTYIVVRDYRINAGSLAGRSCDVAIAASSGVPYVAPAAIHTRPALVPMDMSSSLRTQQSSIGPEWQYWSRVLSVQPTPRTMVTHIATIFSEV